MLIVANPRTFKIPDWFLNRQKDHKDGRNSQLTSSQLDTKLREDLERLKKIRSAEAPWHESYHVIGHRTAHEDFLSHLCTVKSSDLMSLRPQVMRSLLLPSNANNYKYCSDLLLNFGPLNCRNHRGLRHYWGLRVKGQHTKTTGRRGKTVGVAKKR